jgi:hypothetical protein
MELGVLARSLEPLPEESLPGYLLRLAHRLDQSPARVASRCGLSNQPGRIPADYLLAIPADVANVFAGTARLSATEVRNLALHRFVNTYPTLNKSRANGAKATTVFSDNWALSFSSRYCPTCLAGDTSPIQRALGGPWKLRWHLPVVFACPVHHQLLDSTCPACGNALNRTPRGHTNLIKRPTSNKLHPHQCRNIPTGDGGRGRRPCGARLDQASDAGGAELPTEDVDRMLALQLRLDQRLAPGRGIATPGREPDNTYFLDLVAASQLIKLSWPVGSPLAPSDAVAALIDDHAAPILSALQVKLATKTNDRVPGLWSAPDNTAQCGALLLAAEALLGDRDRDPAALRERVQPLAHAAFQRMPRKLSRTFRGRDFSPIFARALVRKVHGFHAAGCHGHASLRTPSRDCRFSSDEVPPYLPQTWYDTYFIDFAGRIPHTTTWTKRHLHRAASLKLVEMTAGGSWPECAEILGMPRGAAARTLTVLRLQFANTNLWTAFETTVERIARDLDSNPMRINYAKRRQALNHWQMPEADWTTLCTDIPKLGRMMTRTTGPALGTVLVWTQITQAEHIHCPVFTTMRRAGQDTAHLIDEVAQVLTPASQTTGRLELRSRIDRYAAHLADRCDIGTDPTTPWLS